MHLIKGNKYLIPKHRMTWRNRCWQSQKSDVSCSLVGQHVYKHLRRDFDPLLFTDRLQIMKVSRLSLGNSKLQLHPQISIGLRSGDWLGHSMTLMCFFLSLSFVALTVCFGSSSCWRPIHHPSSVLWLREEGSCPRCYGPSAPQCGEVVL